MGVFVAVDGPKHAGKTTVIGGAVELLRAEGLAVLSTKEPTESFDLSNEDLRTGVDLARMLAQDRAKHVGSTVLPALATFDVVVTDRYIASSLVFQVLDGVSFDLVWELNSRFLLPDLNIFVTADPSSLRRRLDKRGRATRFDRQQDLDREIAQHGTVSTFLAGRGVTVVEVSNGDESSHDLAAEQVAVAIRDCADRR